MTVTVQASQYKTLRLLKSEQHKQRKLQSASTASPITVEAILTEPRTIEATGLPESFLGTLILKTLYKGEVMNGLEIASRLCLHFSSVIKPVLDQLKYNNLIEVKGGDHHNPASYRYHLTQEGLQNAREAWERNRYIGPCPVTLEQYNRVIKIQARQRVRVGQAQVAQAIQGLVLSSHIVECVGPAVNSFKSLFLYGPPGNGKSSIAKIIGYNLMGDMALVPYAIFKDGEVVKVYDKAKHHPLANQQTEDTNHPVHRIDRRWLRCRPPIVTVGGELTLRNLDLAYSDKARYYEAPLQLKANGGLFLIDDFGRQRMAPKELLNRWIVSLEERIDHLTFQSGDTMTIAFETLIVFSTNLDPRELMDEAFLRRIRHKLKIDYPTEEQFRQIFHQECQQRAITFNQENFNYLVQEYYYGYGRPFRACHARDLLDQLTDFAEYLDEPEQMTEALMEKAARSYFAELY